MAKYPQLISNPPLFEAGSPVSQGAGGAACFGAGAHRGRVGFALADADIARGQRLGLLRLGNLF